MKDYRRFVIDPRTVELYKDSAQLSGLVCGAARDAFAAFMSQGLLELVNRGLLEVKLNEPVVTVLQTADDKTEFRISNPVTFKLKGVERIDGLETQNTQLRNELTQLRESVKNLLERVK